MSYYVAGDIGGTKTLLQLASADGKTVLQRSYASAAAAGLDEMLAAFLHEAGVKQVDAACFALAGPVGGRVVQLTNLSWAVDADALSECFSIPQVDLINDFAAVGHGVTALSEQDLLTLQQGQPCQAGVKLVVGAGTGLGVAWLTPAHGAYRVHASEGGHMDFAPQNAMQIDLLRYLQDKHGHVSYERIVSGPGLLALFDFVTGSGRASPSDRLLHTMATGDGAAALTEAAGCGNEPAASMALGLFMDIYGAFAGNMALACLPYGGIYVAGGIGAKIAPQLQRGGFKAAFNDKGRFASLMQQLPLHIVLDQQVGLMGAALYARNAILRKGE